LYTKRLSTALVIVPELGVAFIKKGLRKFILVGIVYLAYISV
jgi:hypothetical protein